VPAAAAFAAPRAFRHDHFHPNILERELIVNHSEKFNCPRIRRVRATHLNPRPFSGKLRMGFGTLAIQ
jgi:hypothetical protein